MKPILAEGGYGFLIFVIIMIISGISKIVRKAKADRERYAPRQPVPRPGRAPGEKAISLKDFLQDLEGEPTPPPAPPQPMMQPHAVPPPPPRPGMPQRPPAPPRPPMPPGPVTGPRPVRPQPQAAPARSAQTAQRVVPADQEIDISSIDDKKIEEKFEFQSSFEKEPERSLVSPGLQQTGKKKGIHVGAYKITARGHGIEVGLTPQSARQAIVVSEILRPPLARRRERRG